MRHGCGAVRAVQHRRGGPVKPISAAGVLSCAALYLAAWAAYYAGIVNAAVILTLCLAPCAALLLFSLARKNAPALLAAACFTLCHLIYAVINFIL